MPPVTTDSPASLECPQCEQSFRRREHLRRHLDRHSGARTYACSICSKSFSRRDTLKRHVGTHGVAAIAALADQEPRDHRRACEACARAKQRCDGNASGSVPCSKCASKERQCVYPASSVPEHDADGGSEMPGLHSPGHPAQEDEIFNAQSTEAFATPTASVAATGNGQGQLIQRNPPEQTLADATDAELFPTQLDYGLPWDDFLVSSQFLFPLGGGDPETGCFGLQQDTQHDHSFDTVVPVSNTPAEVIREAGPMTAEEDDILVAEYIPHVPPLGIETRAHIINMLKIELLHSQTEDLDSKFPTLRHLDTYVQLYFEHFHPRMPILHVPTFRTSPKAWLLVLAVVCIGCDYSKASLKSEHRRLFQSIAQRVLKTDVTRYRDVDGLARAQALLLLQQTCLSIGRRDALVDVQLYRNVLVTLCRQFIAQDGNPLHNHLVPETTNNTWLQWVRSEARRLLVYFTWLSECYQAVFFMLPPLLSIHELQIALPGAESSWASSYEEWSFRAPPSSTGSVCSAIARVSAGVATQEDSGQPTRLIALFTTFVQQVASQNLSRVMMECHEADANQMSAPALGPTDKLWQTPFDALSKTGCSQPLSQAAAQDIRPDAIAFAVDARLLAILAFTPSRLLLPFSKWQTSAHGCSKARQELLEILSNDAPRARYCLYLSAQLFRHFRTTQASSYFDTLALLMCVLYLVSYIELVELRQRPGTTSRAGDTTSVAKAIRLDQALGDGERDDWLNGKCQSRPHVTGLGLLDTDRSVARVFKEASRISMDNAARSTLAKAMSAIYASQATGRPPDFPNDQSES